MQEKILVKKPKTIEKRTISNPGKALAAPFKFY
jgi:hypothetical protein